MDAQHRPLRVLYQDEWIVAIDKPAGFHVHPPEDTRHRIPRSRNCLALLRDQISQYLYPVHRLDGATSGVLIFALDRDTARALQEQFESREIRKTYVCLVRGWAPPEGTVDRPVDEKPSLTTFHGVGRFEIASAVGRYPTARYTLLEVDLHTGRQHQIRRHLRSISHPIVGDTMYGDRDHNRFFADRLGLTGLFLKAQRVVFHHPKTGETLEIRSRWTGRWHRVFELAGICPSLPN